MGIFLARHWLKQGPVYTTLISVYYDYRLHIPIVGLVERNHLCISHLVSISWFATTNKDLKFEYQLICHVDKIKF